jgi:hypothetical protein
MAWGSLGRVLLQVGMVAGGAIGRAVLQAYKEAAAGRGGSGPAASKLIRRRMSPDEAKKVAVLLELPFSLVLAPLQVGVARACSSSFSQLGWPSGDDNIHRALPMLARQLAGTPSQCLLEQRQVGRDGAHGS